MGATPTMNRSAKDGERSSPHYGGEGVTHSPIEPRCLLTARYGRFMRDPRRPVGVLVLNQVSDPISESETGSDAPPGVGDTCEATEQGEATLGGRRGGKCLTQ